MINKITIKNFKSINELDIELGRFNILIGENGCGKSNILEAIAFGAAASADKLDYEFLGNRGIRVTNPEFMFSAFNNSKKKKSITVNFVTDEQEYFFKIENKTNNPKRWFNKNKEIVIKEINRIIKAIYLEDDEQRRNEIFDEINEGKEFVRVLSEFFKKSAEFLKVSGKEIDSKDILPHINLTILEKAFSHHAISNYIIYSPEESSLRKFLDSAQILPLGIRGEGLFQYLKELTYYKGNAKTLNAIKNNLFLLNWYENFDLPENLMKNEYALRIKDKYLHTKLKYFDQRSTNEGFLLLLFYSTLFISKLTPTFFAIDNIDASLNPKLCRRLTKDLSSLAKKYKKQVILTTHNPSVLDGINLEDKEQRLFVIYRNKLGHTKLQRIFKPELSKGEEPVKLSEAFTRGYLGGLPKNF